MATSSPCDNDFLQHYLWLLLISPAIGNGNSFAGWAKQSVPNSTDGHVGHGMKPPLPNLQMRTGYSLNHQSLPWATFPATHVIDQKIMPSREGSPSRASANVA
ncbi:MAG: hypothetical protein WC007_08390 [Pelobacteraceae bacterium]